MSDFIVTPTNIDFLESIFRNPLTGRWTIPILTFNTAFMNPYYGEVDPLNEDPRYQKSVIDHIYMRLKEKWLYKSYVFEKLLKYFKIEQNGEEGKVQLVLNPKGVDTSLNEKYKKHIFKYIEQYFITKHFVSKVIKQYVRTTHIKWYDLLNNTDTLKDLFAHKLKKLIKSVIYELRSQSNEKL